MSKKADSQKKNRDTAPVDRSRRVEPADPDERTKGVDAVGAPNPVDPAHRTDTMMIGLPDSDQQDDSEGSLFADFASELIEDRDADSAADSDSLEAHTLILRPARSRSTQVGDDGESLVGYFLVATPSIQDKRFAETVIIVCSHDDHGAMGLVINRASPAIGFDEILTQLEIEKCAVDKSQIRVFAGGPVESGRGFVLHSSDYMRRGTIDLVEGICLTATIDVVRDIAAGCGPSKHTLVLGYAGWGRGHLEEELRRNLWLHVPVSSDLVFDTRPSQRWIQAVERAQVDLERLSPLSGTA